jgi:membrane-bound lytic murein transglycosylase D
MKKIRPPFSNTSLLLLCSCLVSFSAHADESLNLALTNAISPITAPNVPDQVLTAANSVNKLQVLAPQTDLWVRIRNGYAIPDVDTAAVITQLNWYGTHNDYMQRVVERGSRYLYHVVEELDKRGMPMELALLPFIESAFNPQAISTAKAAGMWQFMAATGKDFNLKQSMFKDDRRGVLDSTDAALNYLSRLYDLFGDWQLALAAYNWGEGSVQRAIKRQQALGLPIDFVSMASLMPPETRNYLPKLQAVKNIIANPELFGLTLAPLDNQPYFVSVEKNRDIDVQLAARLAELPLPEFNALNPQFNRPVITGNANTKILLPIDNAALFRENLGKWQGSLSSWQTYTVTKTEKIESLSQRLSAHLGIKPDVIREVNFIPLKTMVKAGSTVLIPKTGKSPDQDISTEIAERAQLVLEKQRPARLLTIRIRKNENLATIANRYAVSAAQVKAWNHLKTEKLTLGQSLKVMVSVAEQTSGTKSRIVKRIVQTPKLVHQSPKTKLILASAKTGKKLRS